VDYLKYKKQTGYNSSSHIMAFLSSGIERITKRAVFSLLGKESGNAVTPQYVAASVIGKFENTAI